MKNTILVVFLAVFQLLNSGCANKNDIDNQLHQRLKVQLMNNSASNAYKNFYNAIEMSAKQTALDVDCSQKAEYDKEEIQ